MVMVALTAGGSKRYGFAAWFLALAFGFHDAWSACTLGACARGVVRCVAHSRTGSEAVAVADAAVAWWWCDRCNRRGRRARCDMCGRCRRRLDGCRQLGCAVGQGFDVGPELVQPLACRGQTGLWPAARDRASQCGYDKVPRKRHPRVLDVAGASVPGRTHAIAALGVGASNSVWSRDSKSRHFAGLLKVSADLQ